ncbi:MAG: Mth938-like domain-containing protein [Chloroflexota bacterium]
MSDTQTRVKHISWGRMIVEVNGAILEFKDCKVWPGGAKTWDWNVTGTRHQPGVQLADIEEILEQGVEVVVLSRGMDLMLHTCPETEELLRSKGIDYHIEETKRAVELFNQLSQQGKRVGGIFHSTC